MLKDQASVIYNSICRDLSCSIDNDFQEQDQYYVRVFVYVEGEKGIQVLIKGSLYNPKLVLVGLGSSGIGFKTFPLNHSQLSKPKALRTYIIESYNKQKA